MVKKALIFAFMALNVFTLTSIDADVPGTYQEITFNNFQFDANFLEGAQTDNVYFDLWTFNTFNTATIEIDGTVVVDLGQSIEGVDYFFDIVGGNHFKLLYDNRTFLFSLEQLDIEGIGVIPQYTVFARSVSPPPLESDLEVKLYLDNPSNILEPDVEGGLLELLVGYGVFNTSGLLMLFAVVILIVNIALAFLGVPSIVYIIGNAVITIGFTFVNFIPIWVTFVLMSVLVLFLILSIKGVKV